jgi:hypothetical protein
LQYHRNQLPTPIVGMLQQSSQALNDRKEPIIEAANTIGHSAQSSQSNPSEDVLLGIATRPNLEKTEAWKEMNFHDNMANSAPHSFAEGSCLPIAAGDSALNASFVFLVDSRLQQQQQESLLPDKNPDMANADATKESQQNSFLKISSARAAVSQPQHKLSSIPASVDSLDIVQQHHLAQELMESSSNDREPVLTAGLDAKTQFGLTRAAANINKNVNDTGKYSTDLADPTLMILGKRSTSDVSGSHSAAIFARGDNEKQPPQTSTLIAATGANHEASRSTATYFETVTSPEPKSKSSVQTKRPPTATFNGTNISSKAPNQVVGFLPRPPTQTFIDGTHMKQPHQLASFLQNGVLNDDKPQLLFNPTNAQHHSTKNTSPPEELRLPSTALPGQRTKQQPQMTFSPFVDKSPSPAGLSLNHGSSVSTSHGSSATSKVKPTRWEKLTSVVTASKVQTKSSQESLPGVSVLSVTATTSVSDVFQKSDSSLSSQNNRVGLDVKSGYVNGSQGSASANAAAPAEEACINSQNGEDDLQHRQISLNSELMSESTNATMSTHKERVSLKGSDVSHFSRQHPLQNVSVVARAAIETTIGSRKHNGTQSLDQDKCNSLPLNHCTGNQDRGSLPVAADERMDSNSTSTGEPGFPISSLQVPSPDGTETSKTKQANATVTISPATNSQDPHAASEAGCLPTMGEPTQAAAEKNQQSIVLLQLNQNIASTTKQVSSGTQRTDDVTGIMRSATLPQPRQSGNPGVETIGMLTPTGIATTTFAKQTSPAPTGHMVAAPTPIAGRTLVMPSSGESRTGLPKRSQQSQPVRENDTTNMAFRLSALQPATTRKYSFSEPRQDSNNKLQPSITTKDSYSRPHQGFEKKRQSPANDTSSAARPVQAETTTPFTVQQRLAGASQSASMPDAGRTGRLAAAATAQTQGHSPSQHKPPRGATLTPPVLTVTKQHLSTTPTKESTSSSPQHATSSKSRPPNYKKNFPQGSQTMAAEAVNENETPKHSQVETSVARPLEEQEAQVLRAAALVAEEIRCGSWPSGFEENRHTKQPTAVCVANATVVANAALQAYQNELVAMIECFAREIVLPSIMSCSDNIEFQKRPSYPEGSRVYLGTLLALREVMTQNAEIFFGSTAITESVEPRAGTIVSRDSRGAEVADRGKDEEHYSNDIFLGSSKPREERTAKSEVESENEDNPEARRSQLLKEEERLYSARLLATGVVLSATLRLPASQTLHDELLRMIDAYDFGREEFAACLESTDGNWRGVLPNGSSLNRDETIAWKASFNRVREDHPLIVQSKRRKLRESCSEAKVCWDRELDIVMVAKPNLCFVGVVEDLTSVVIEYEKRHPPDTS